MSRYIYTLIMIALSLNLFSQVETYTNTIFEGNSYNTIVIKIDSESIKSFDILQNKSFQTVNEFQNTLSASTPFFLINASISDTLCNPIGLFIKNSKIIQPLNLNDGFGNFFLKPNGAILFTSEKVIICESTLVPYYDNIRLGIQSGPMLINNGIIHPKFSVSSTNKLIRCGVGTYSNSSGENFIVFSISNAPVSFYDFSMYFLNKFNCQQALCLESNSCVMVLPNSTTTNENPNNLICNFIYFKI